MHKWLSRLLPSKGEQRTSALRNPFENPDVPINATSVDQFFDGNIGNTAGQRVHEDDALRHSPVWAAIDLISHKIAELPLLVQRSSQEGQREAWRRAKDHPSYDVLLTWIGPTRGPSAGQMTAYQWLAMSAVNLLLYGNSFTWLRRNGMGQVVEMRPIHPIRVQMWRRTGNPGSLFYTVTQVSSGDVRGPIDSRVPTGPIEQREMLHFRHMAPRAHWGLSPIRYGARSVGRNMSTEDYVSEFYINDGSPGGMFTPERPMPPDQQDKLLRSWRERHEGVGAHHRFAIAPVPGKFESIGVTPRSGAIEGILNYGVRDVARIYRIPATFLADPTAKAYNSNIEEGRSLLRNTLDPWLMQIENECSVKVMSLSEIGSVRCEFDRSIYTRGDTTAADLRQLVEAGIINSNEAREKIGMNPRPGGDEFMSPLNMQVGDESNGESETEGDAEGQEDSGGGSERGNGQAKHLRWDRRPAGPVLS